MAKEFISKERLELFWTKLKTWITSYLSDNSYVKDASYTHTDSNFTAAEKSKLSGIADGANKYTLPTASSSTLGGVKTGDNITNTSGTISITKANVTNALGYTPPTTNTTYSVATTSAAGLMSASDKTKLDSVADGANKYTLPAATSSSLGGVKIGSNISVATDGTISVPAMDWSNINNKPTKVSQFTNDSAYITKAVSDLTNYYKKSEVYTQAEVNSLLSGITGISVEVVTALPTTGTNGVIYLVAHSHGTGDAYDEYVWVASKSAFEKIGSTDVDLSGYWAKADLTECTEDEIIALFS